MGRHLSLFSKKRVFFIITTSVLVAAALVVGQEKEPEVTVIEEFVPYIYRG
jgi:hypothetical protein